MENILIPGGKLELNEITANKEKNTISYLSQIYDIDEDTGRVSVDVRLLIRAAFG